MTAATVDFVVVGAGSAGCVLAARLSEDPRNRVAILEAGGHDWNPMLHIPLASGRLLRSGLHGWKYVTEPVPGLGGRRLSWARGKVLGGSSSINGMVYVRGHRSDYDDWAALGNRGWSYREVLPYFLRSEGSIDRGGPFHGSDGPLKVARAGSPNPLYAAFVEAGVQAGFAATDDFNGARQEGVGRYDFNIDRGRRCSAATAFLRPALGCRNLQLVTSAQVTRVVVAEGRAVGVEFARAGQRQTMLARREVILAGGVVNSPQLLMLSGIGDAGHLGALGIAVLHHLPEVGRGLQDHVDVPLRFACPHPVTLHSQVRLDRILVAMVEAVLLRRGPATSFPTEAGAFLRSRSDIARPDLQFHFSISLGGSRIRVPLLQELIRPDPLEREGFQICPCVIRPKSRGEIRLASPDPLVAPLIAPNYLGDADDLALLREGVGIGRRIARQAALAPYISEEIGPPPQTEGVALDAFIRDNAFAPYHPVGSCAMGRRRVVSDELRVHGIDGLRIADASVMPTLIGGNTHAPTVMIAEKAADLILGRTPPPAAPEAAGVP